MLKKLLHEPLLHFLALGGLLFLFYFFSEQKQESKNSIVISKERIEQLTSELEKKSLSILSTEEKQKMIGEEIYQTVLFKEALKIGLDKNDDDIKKHVVDKMEFVIYDTYDLPTPSEEALKKFMLENPKDYREEGKIHFTQSMMGAGIGDFEKEYTLTGFEASTIFGRSFSEVLLTLKADEKVQKIESDYGVHEIKIISKPTAKLKAFSLVKEELKNHYLSAKREQKNKTIYEVLKSQYDISIEEK